MTEPYNPSPAVRKCRSWLETQIVKFIGRHTPKCREVVGILPQEKARLLPSFFALSDLPLVPALSGALALSAKVQPETS